MILGALLMAAPSFSEQLEMRADLVLHDESARWGGLSGVDVRLDENRFYAVSDRGTIWRGEFVWDGERLEAVDALEFAPILTSKGEPVEDYNIDAEEIDSDDAGNFYISFESNSRVSRFPKWDGAAELIPSAEEFINFGFNSGPEAMCIGADGDIWLSPERSGLLERPFPIFQFDGSKWETRSHIPRKPPYLLVGMDFDPDAKRLYVLERYLYLGTLIRSRIRAFDYVDGALENEEELWLGETGKYGNLEGISYFERGGKRYLMLISDDNFFPLLATHLIQMEIIAR